MRPFGRLAAGPLHRQAGVLTLDLDLGLCLKARRTLDVAGHYGRPDLFRLEVDRQARSAAADRATGGADGVGGTG